MINRSHRFHGYGSLRYTYRHGQTVRGPLCSIKYVSNPKRNTYRLSVVVNKKVSKSAVKRNRIRRRLYEVFRSCETLIHDPIDMVVTVFSDQLAELPINELNQLVKAQLRQAGLIKTKS